MAKNDHVHENGKVGRSNATPTIFFSVDSYDLQSLSFKFGNDTFITFEMPRVSYRRPVGKMNISLLFRPSVIRGPWFIRLYFTVSGRAVMIVFVVTLGCAYVYLCVMFILRSIFNLILFLLP